MRLTGYQLNTYLALLVVTVVASGAALIIVHVATTTQTASALGNEAPYQGLERSILRN